jgi:cytochrome b561
MAKIKTRRKMGWLLIAFHWMMMLCTVGLWTPVYLAARRRRVTVTHVPDGYNGVLPPTR